MKISKRSASFGLCIAALCFANIANASDEALKRLVAQARDTQSAAMLFLRDGKEVADYHENAPSTASDAQRIDLRAATQSIVALGVGLLLKDGLIETIDTPVHRFFPEWKQGRKESITLRMLLNQTSGLPDLPNAESADVVRFALAAELQSDPGTQFAASKLNADLLLATIARASGKRAEEYFAERLFTPLGLDDVTWQKDNAGNALGGHGLTMNAKDAAVLGELVLARGKWNGEAIIPETFIDEMLNPQLSKSVEYGLLWMRTPAWIRLSVDDSSLDLLRQLNAPEGVIGKVAALKGRKFDSSESLVSGLHKVLSDDEFDELYRSAQASGIRMGTLFHLELGPMAAFSAAGDGQFIVILPSAKVVAVRQTVAADDRFDDFVERVIEVARKWDRTLKPSPHW